MKFGFYLPASEKILLTSLRRSPYDGVGLFLLLLFPHRDKLSFALKVIQAANRGPLPLGARAVWISNPFLESKERSLSNVVRQAGRWQKDSGPA